MDINPSQTTTSINNSNITTPEQPCPSCIKLHKEVKESIVALDQKMNVILLKMEEIISSKKEEQFNGKNECVTNGKSIVTTSKSMNHETTATNDGKDLVYPVYKNVNGNFNNSINNSSSNGVRKRKQQPTTTQNGTTSTASKFPKQEIQDHNSIFNSSMPMLIPQEQPEQPEHSPPMSNQQFLDSLTLATVLGGTEGNAEVLNAFFQSDLFQSDPNLLMNVLNATIQDSVNGGGSAAETTTSTSIASKKRTSTSRKSSSKQPSAAVSPPSTTATPNLQLMGNERSDDLSEEQLRDALAISAEAAGSQQCSNCFATKTSAWRRNQEGQLICNACGLYYRMHQTNRPIHLRKNHIQTRYRKKNGELSATSSPSPMLLSMDDGDENNSEQLGSSFNFSGYENLILGTTAAAMAK